MAPINKDPVDLTAETEKKTDNDKKKSSTKNGKDEEMSPEDAMSEEDWLLKERLETCVSTVVNEEKEAAVTVAIRQNALDMIVTELRTATSSMTSVPKPLKFLRPHFAKIKDCHASFAGDGVAKDALEFRARLADVLAVLSMTMGKAGTCTRSWSRVGLVGSCSCSAVQSSVWIYPCSAVVIVHANRSSCRFLSVYEFATHLLRHF